MSLTEVVGGSGRMGSQFMRLLGNAVALPRGVCPGSLGKGDTPIYVCTPASSWVAVYCQTLPSRRSDLVFVGNGLLHTRGIRLDDVTVVIPHYAVLHVGDTPVVAESAPPTYLAGPHAVLTQSLLHRDGIVNTAILTHVSDITIKAAQKLLWTSCLWLLCHSGPDKPPISVSRVHSERRSDLEVLVRELWPSFCSIVSQDDDSSATSTEKLLTLHETMQYLEQYSNSIPNAVPSVQLAVAELEDRNGVFADCNQPFHQQLIQQVVGPQALHIFEPNRDGGNDIRDEVSERSRMRIIVDLRETSGLAVHGTTTHSNNAPTRRRRKVLIVGAGMLGSSVALNLTRRTTTTTTTAEQLDITVVDTGEDETDTGPTTRASWGWLNANQKKPASYQQLNSLGMHAWRCDPSLRDLPTWNGSLVRYEQALEAADVATSGYYAKPLGPLTQEEVHRLDNFANFAPDREAPGAAVYSFPNEGHVDPCVAVKAMRQGAVERGVTFVWNHKVTHVLYSGDADDAIITGVECCKVRRDTVVDCTLSTRTISADVVVVAAGMGSENSALGGLPLLHRPGRIAFARQQQHSAASLTRILVDAVAKTHVLQRRDGSIVTGGGTLEVGGSSVAIVVATAAMSESGVSQLLTLEERQHDFSSASDPLLAGARQLAPEPLRDAKLTHTAQALRPMPKDGLPSVGYIRPNLYSLVSHSGITLAPLLGSLAATEIADGVDLDLLTPYRPTRFVATPTR
jgi:glycine/D-amino acid oxidase-like deaminating enzyme